MQYIQKSSPPTPKCKSYTGQKSTFFDNMSTKVSEMVNVPGIFVKSKVPEKI